MVVLKAVEAGNATKDGINGADFWMKYLDRLPDYYISKEELRELGWKEGKSPKKFAPGKMITRGIYRNDDKHLPHITGRMWSNDGLIFVTYDHYATFYEIIYEGILWKTKIKR